MHLFVFSFYAAGVLYAFFHQPSLILYFLFFVGGYILIAALYPGAKPIGIRKKLMLGTWSPPSEGIIHLQVKVRTEKVEKIIRESPPEQKLTITHFVIKAVGQILHKGSDVNGKLVFGKFVPYKTCDVSCLVNIDGGKDLAMLLITEVEKKSINDIATFLSDKGKKIQANKGDADHKNRTGAVAFLPAFLVSIMLEVMAFLVSNLGLSIPALSAKKDQFGAACVTSLGGFGFQDAVAPFSGFTRCTFFASVCTIHQQPVVQNGKVEVGRILNMNFTADHRYIDGGKAKSFVPAFKKVFESPELFLERAGSAQSSKEE